MTVTRRQFLAAAGAGATTVLLSGVPAAAAGAGRARATQPRSGVVIVWNDAFLQGVRDSNLGPPMVARAIAIVHTAIYDQFVEKIAAKAANLKVGPSHDPGNYMGPVINSSAKRTILEYIDTGKQEGRLVAQGAAGSAYLRFQVC